MGEPVGILLLDKPRGWTSHDVVARTRRWYGTKKVGHAGTLDPMATGLLVLGLGPGTKLLTWLVGASKTYTATIRLGASTPTDDADSAPDTFSETEALALVDEASIDAAIATLTGDIQQVPSQVSAIKVDGRRSYARVRAGESVTLKPRPVRVSEFVRHEMRTVENTGADGPGHFLDLDVTVSCSAGTYIRALARDLGAALGVHGHLTALRRTRVGSWHVADASGVPGRDADIPPVALIPLEVAAAQVLPTRTLGDDEAQALRYGQLINASGAPGPIAAIDGAGLVSVIEDSSRGAKPVVVFRPAN